ncbi:hypothetical protein WAI453_012335 [Rhynchosporium graminicola]
MPTFSLVTRLRRSATKLEAHLPSEDFIDSGLSYDPYDSCSDTQDLQITLPTSQILRSASTSEQATRTTPQSSRKRSLRSAGSPEPVFVKGGSLVSPDDAKKRKLEEFHNVEDISSQDSNSDNRSCSIGARSLGLVTLDKSDCLHCMSLDQERNRRKVQDGLPKSFDSGYVSEIDLPTDCIRRFSETDRQHDSSPFQSQYERRRSSLTRRLSSARAMERKRTSSSSPPLWKNTPMMSNLTIDEKHKPTKLPRRVRSRSPPRDRDSSEASAESRFNLDESYSSADDNRDPRVSLARKEQEDHAFEHETGIQTEQDICQSQYPSNDDASFSSPTINSALRGTQRSPVVATNTLKGRKLSMPRISRTPPHSTPINTVLALSYAPSSTLPADEGISHVLHAEKKASSYPTSPRCFESIKAHQYSTANMRTLLELEEFRLPSPAIPVELPLDSSIPKDT